MKAGLASFEFRNNDLDFNMNQIKHALFNFPEADLICFGEAFLQGFDALSWNYEIDKNIALSQDSSVFQTLKLWTKMTNKALMIGYIERENECLYSSYALISQGNVVHNYRRITKGWKEISKTDSHYCEGTEIHSFHFKGKNFLIALCGDLWDTPESFKTDCTIIWPVYVDYSKEEWSTALEEYAAQAQLASNHVFFINSISKNPSALGGAFVFEKGQVTQALPFETPGMLIVEC